MTKLAQQNVEKHFLSGKPLTVQSCLRLYGTTELRVIVARLRKTFIVNSEWIKSTSGARFKRYWMPLGTIRNGNRRA